MEDQSSLRSGARPQHSPQPGTVGVPHMSEPQQTESRPGPGVLWKRSRALLSLRKGQPLLGVVLRLSALMPKPPSAASASAPLSALPCPPRLGMRGQ